MPIFIEIALRPVIGYAQYHLERGKTPSQVVAQLKRTHRYGDLAEEDLRRAVAQARANLVATHRLAGPRTGRTFIDAFKGTVEPGDTVGVRVVMIGIMRSGKMESFSVTVNAPAQADPRDVLLFARDWAVSGGLAARGRGTEPVEVEHAEITSVQPYGFRNPTLQF